MAAIHAKIYQFATPTYHLLIAIEMTLLDQSVHTSWPTVRDTLKSDQICTVVLPTDDASALRIRKAATPEPDVENLYRTLGIASQIIKPQHSWTPSDRDLQKAIYLIQKESVSQKLEVGLSRWDHWRRIRAWK